MKRFSIVLTLTLSITLGVYQPALAGSHEGHSDPRMEVAEQMVQAWNEQDWERVYDLFAEDGILHSMMIDPIVGRENIRARLSVLAEGIEQIELQIRHAGMIDDVVVLERVDDFTYNGKHGRVPVVGVMEIENGKVTEWREYYDHKSLADTLVPDPKPEAEILAESEQEIRALIEKLQVDWNKGDMSAYLAAYWKSDEFSLMYGSTGVRGWQSVSDLFTGNWSTEEAMGDFMVADVAVRFAGTDMAIASGSFEHQFPTEKIIGAFSHVFRKFEGEGWLIIHEHTSRGSVE